MCVNINIRPTELTVCSMFNVLFLLFMHELSEDQSRHPASRKANKDKRWGQETQRARTSRADNKQSGKFAFVLRPSLLFLLSDPNDAEKSDV